MSSKHIVLGVCGGIAAYKSVELLRLLTKHGFRVSVVMTDTATKFVGAETFKALTPDAVVVGNLWSTDDPSPHTTLGRTADLVVVAPATARLISDLATGRSGDALTATLLATKAPVVVCPAMHTEMWEHPAVEANISTLRQRGVTVVDPEHGDLAGGDIGAGRLASPSTIAQRINQHLQPNTLEGKRFVVTAGGTREAIDAVRFIGNRSSGKQGHAVAQVAAERGAQVTLISTTNVSADLASNLFKVLRVETAAEMQQAVVSEIQHSDVLVMAAAVADFRPKHPAAHKIKKHLGTPEITLEPTPDILKELNAPNCVVVGFAAETTDLIDNARTKLASKHLDVVVANDVSMPNSGFDHDNNSATIITRNGGEYTTGLVDKRTVAEALMDTLEKMMESSK